MINKDTHTLAKELPRISRSISGEVRSIGKLLRSLADDRERVKEFVSRPAAQLKAVGLDLEKYASSKVSVKTLERDIARIASVAMERSLLERLRGVQDIANTYSSRTETSYEYNFNHSTSTDYKYESHTGTERGTFSETSTGQATDTKTSFRGISLQGYLDLVRGPLISPEAIRQIQVQIQQTLAKAAARAEVR